MSSMDNLFIQISNQIQEKTCSVLKELCGIWQNSYKEETIISNCKKLIDHVNDLYDDIIEEAETVQQTYIHELEKLMAQMTEVCKSLSEPLPKESLDDLVLYDAIAVLKEKLTSYNEIFLERTEIVNSLLAKENALCNELGTKPKSLTKQPLPSSKTLQEFELYMSGLEDEIQTRKEEITKLREDLVKIFDELEIKPALEFEVVLLSGSDLKVTDNIMAHVRKLHAEYSERLERSKDTVLELRERLSHLWERLEEDISIRNAFLQKYPGHGNQTALAFRDEINKCEERKRNNIKVFIEKLRKEICVWWDKCMISGDERAKFTAFKSDFYTEDLLTLHEMMVEQLEHFYINNQRIFELLSKRYDLWEKLVVLENKSNDANRYNNRGGKLLQEEKERKKIASQLPKVEEELITLSNEYTNETGKIFTAFGEDIETMIKNKHLERKMDKECQLSARKQAKAVTPVAASSTRTRLFSTTKSSINILSTPTPMKQRKKSPVRTPRLPSLRNTRADNIKSTPLSIKTTSNILSIKKGSVTKRRSGPKKSDTKMKKTLVNVPAEDLLNSSKTYAQFKTHLAKNSHLRSSIAPNKPTNKDKVDLPKVVITENTPPSTRMTRQNTCTSFNQKTPRMTRSASTTVLTPGILTNKLSTKNLPIII